MDYVRLGFSGDFWVSGAVNPIDRKKKNQKKSKSRIRDAASTTRVGSFRRNTGLSPLGENDWEEREESSDFRNFVLISDQEIAEKFLT